MDAPAETLRLAYATWTAKQLDATTEAERRTAANTRAEIREVCQKRGITLC